VGSFVKTTPTQVDHGVVFWPIAHAARALDHDLRCSTVV
jgi:hypothetical protein